MDDLSAMLNQVMSDPESMRKIQALASSLGLAGENAEPPPPAPAPPPAAGSSTPDLSALASLLSGLNQPQPQPQPQNTSPDLSALAQLLSDAKSASATQAPPQGGGLGVLSGLLGGLGGGNADTAGSGISTLTALLNGGSAPSQPSPGMLPNIDAGTIMKLTQALASLQNNKANIDLLLALKPRLKEDRSKKVDDAIRVMQLIQFLPLIKESGLFGEMDKILGGLGTGSGGGIGGLLGNLGNGLGGLLGGLGGR